MTAHLDDLMDPELLMECVATGLVTVRQHPDPSVPLDIYNYTAKAAYDRLWNDATLNCRGLIVHRETARVEARPFPKFFNHGEELAHQFRPDERVRPSDKMDGSLGVLYNHPWGVAIATRGSFESEQALRGTRMLQPYLNGWWPEEGLTYLFEIIYPENRIVVDYAGHADLYLLRVLNTEDGMAMPDGDWPGRVADRWPVMTYAEALAMPPRPNREGLVLEGYSGERVKVKQEDYVRLHKLVTGLNERSVWEAGVAGIGDLVESIPDEFHDWVGDVYERLLAQAERIEGSARVDFRDVSAAVSAGEPMGLDPREHRKQFARLATQLDCADLLFMLLDGKDIWDACWAKVRPQVTRTMLALTEDNS